MIRRIESLVPFNSQSLILDASVAGRIPKSIPKELCGSIPAVDLTAVISKRFPGALIRDQREALPIARVKWMSNVKVRSATSHCGAVVNAGQRTYRKFNGRLRDECLNTNWFCNLFEARRKISLWRADYNTLRPHSGLAYRTPEEFAQQWQRPSFLATPVQKPTGPTYGDRSCA